MLQVLRDTVFVAAKSASMGSEWAVGALVSILGSLGAWALIRSVDQGQRIQKIETFVGVENEDGLSGKIDKLTHSNDTLVQAVHGMAVTVARLDERGTQHIRPGS